MKDAVQFTNLPGVTDLYAAGVQFILRTLFIVEPSHFHRGTVLFAFIQNDLRTQTYSQNRLAGLKGLL
jgi:hypothetical protein